eukprot:Tamp_26227.p1 GENE.Tamp_26227~~Tamp_26227.p1  ORF type:complete len:243 (-),score=32.56 Tamp_26227:93-821(-)
MEVRGTETEAAAPAVDKGLLADVFPTSIARHNTFGWQYDLALTADENYMDLAALVARNSLCNGGHMGCVLVKDGDIMAVATNTPLFQPYASDVHAEVNAVSGCARNGRSTAGATAYITMPPCKQCFMVLQAAGIKRIVSRHHTSLENCSRAAHELGISWGLVKDTPQGDDRRARYVANALAGDASHKQHVVAQRLARKQEQQQEPEMGDETSGVAFVTGQANRMPTPRVWGTCRRLPPISAN